MEGVCNPGADCLAKNFSIFFDWLVENDLLFIFSCFMFLYLVVMLCYYIVGGVKI